MTIDIPIRYIGDYTKQSPISLEFFLTAKSKVKAARANFEHFTQFLDVVNARNLPVPPPPKNHKEAKEAKKSEHFVVLAESEQAVNHLIDSHIGSVIAQLGHETLLDLHITDQYVYNKYPLFLRARFALGSTPEEQDKVLKGVQMIFTMCDRIVRLKLSPENQARADKTRRKVDLIKNKEKFEEREAQQIAKRKEEQAAFEAKLRSLPPEKQRKLEEKRHKQELQQQKKKMTKITK